MSTVSFRTKPTPGEPAWEVAELFPVQGEWTEEEYLALPGNRLVEFSDGVIEVLPVPTKAHQLILGFLYTRLLAFVEPRKLGTVLLAGMRVRLRKGKFRQPDLVFVTAEHADRAGEDYCRGADLVMEIVSGDPKDRERDLKTKPAEYAQAGISEYWIIDPQHGRITVMRRKARKYVVHGKSGRGERASSHLLKGFALDVDAVFAAGGA